MGGVPGDNNGLGGAQVVPLPAFGPPMLEEDGNLGLLVAGFLESRVRPADEAILRYASLGFGGCRVVLGLAEAGRGA